MEMDDLKNDELEIDINDSNPLPDLRTVISRPSSISDIESDDYQIKPKHKKYLFYISILCNCYIQSQRKQEEKTEGINYRQTQSDSFIRKSTQVYS